MTLLTCQQGTLVGEVCRAHAGCELSAPQIVSGSLKLPQLQRLMINAYYMFVGKWFYSLRALKRVYWERVASHASRPGTGLKTEQWSTASCVWTLSFGDGQGALQEGNRAAV